VVTRFAERTAKAVAPATAANPSETTFVVAQVRQALQQTAAMGACSPYLPAA
jgi:hypothetical protein